jgi:(2Fe-2S) ferredoxin
MTGAITGAMTGAPQRRCVMVCQYRSCRRNGAAEVLAAFRAAVPVEAFVSGSDCMGQCAAGVTVRVMPEGSWYCRVRPEHVPQIVEHHLWGNQPVKALLHPRFHAFMLAEPDKPAHEAISGEDIAHEDIAHEDTVRQSEAKF